MSKSGLERILSGWTSQKFSGSAATASFKKEGRVSEARFQRLNNRLREYVQPMMKTTILSDDKRILPDARTMDRLAEAMASFAYGLYALISKRCGLEVEYDLWKKPD